MLTSETLPTAVKNLFELNNYEVFESVEVHGAEIDLIAKPKNDPFGSDVYIEVTVEYVDNTKYGNDVSKLAMMAQKVRLMQIYEGPTEVHRMVIARRTLGAYA